MQAITDFFTELTGLERAKEQTSKEKYRSLVNDTAALVAKGGKPNPQRTAAMLEETGVSAAKFKDDVTSTVRLGELQTQQEELKAKAETQRAIQFKVDDLNERRKAALAEFAKEGDELNAETQAAINAYAKWQNNASEINDLTQKLARL